MREETSKTLKENLKNTPEKAAVKVILIWRYCPLFMAILWRYGQVYLSWIPLDYLNVSISVPKVVSFCVVFSFDSHLIDNNLQSFNFIDHFTDGSFAKFALLQYVSAWEGVDRSWNEKFPAVLLTAK